MSSTKVIVTLYITGVQAVRKTADDCRRLIALMDALGVVYDVAHVDTLEMREFVQSLTGRGQLPLCCVGDACVGSYDELMDAMEDGVLPQKLRDVGYSESIRGGDAIPVKPPPVVVKKTVVKKVVVKKPKGGGEVQEETGNSDEAQASPAVAPEDGETLPSEAGEGGAPSASNDEVPPPPPDDDVPPPPPDDEMPPPPPPDDEIPPPPPDEMPPPPPPDDEMPPPPPPDDDVPPPPPPPEDENDIPPPPPPE